jgi:hypothetical protein
VNPYYAARHQSKREKFNRMTKLIETLGAITGPAGILTGDQVLERSDS